MRFSACDTVSRYCARPVLCWLAFPSASALGSTGSAAGRSALFVGFPATMAESDFSRSVHHRLRLLAFPIRTRPARSWRWPDHGISRFPCKERACVPGSSTTPGCPSACVGALGHIAFHYTDSVGTRDQFSIAAQWLACTFPYRRFADILADACARLGADVVRYSFIVVDLHHLLLAGLPAHLCENSKNRKTNKNDLYERTERTSPRSFDGPK